MPNRLFYIVKLSSGQLKEYNYKINNYSFYDCLKNGLIISLSDSQMLKSIRDITGQQIDRDKLEEWYKERDLLKKRKNTEGNRKRIRYLQDQIYKMMYIPQYITVVMENIKEYEHMFKHGFMFNGKVFKRFSCSASQARVNTIVFVQEDLKDELKRRLDNGRDLKHPLAPSKYNAYFGLYSSAIKQVTEPRFCIVPDYCENQMVDVDFVIEQDKYSDDIIEPRTMDIEFNRFDGSGIISPKMAEQWGKDLGEDYTPCQFCLRYSFTKGMVNEFDFVEWCKENNNGNYIIKDIYGKDVDLREIDVILSEGQVKLWDSWDSQESFIDCCHKNGIIWGVTKYAPKEDKRVLTTNYQFLQTLDLSDEMIEDVCKDTIDYIQGVSYDNIYYSLLFLMGESFGETKIEDFLKSSDNYWLKTLILEHNLLNDKYTKEKIRDMIIRRIELACLGKIQVEGNFQCIVPDNYAYMEHITGQSVRGLLQKGQFYSQYWNNRGTKQVDCMRSPLTHFSEHYVVDLIDNEQTSKWFKYSYSGIIVNVHDEHTMHFAGSDYDYDILSTTNNINFINGRYPNQRVVTYNVKKPHKKTWINDDGTFDYQKFEEDLFTTDTFSFGTQIGQITNTCSTICGLMAEFDKDSKEFKILCNRLKAGCAAQSRQIDKTKIGEDVKTLGTICKQYQRIDETKDTPEQIQEKMFYNRILADKKPYFFRYKYKALAKEYKEYIQKQEQIAELRFSKTLDDLKSQVENEQELTKEEQDFLMYYDKYLPVIDSSCVMNKICKHIEQIDFHIKQKVRSNLDFNYQVLMSNNSTIDDKLLKQISELLETTFKAWEEQIKTNKKKKGQLTIQNASQGQNERDNNYQELLKQLYNICSNSERLANHLVYYFYVTKPSSNKGALWGIAGKEIYENVKNRKTNLVTKQYSIDFPIKDVNGDLQFLYDKYQIKHLTFANGEVDEDD